MQAFCGVMAKWLALYTATTPLMMQAFCGAMAIGLKAASSTLHSAGNWKLLGCVARVVVTAGEWSGVERRRFVYSSTAGGRSNYTVAAPAGTNVVAAAITSGGRQSSAAIAQRHSRYSKLAPGTFIDHPRITILPPRLLYGSYFRLRHLLTLNNSTKPLCGL